MSIDQEIWYHKIINNYSSGIPIVFCCKKTKVEMSFVIDRMQIRQYYETMFVKWIDGEKYYRISNRNFGLSNILWLYVDETGEQFVIDF